MNDKEYVKKICSKCANRYNEKDLCNIVRTMDGNCRCSNEDIKKENKLKKNLYNENDRKGEKNGQNSNQWIWANWSSCSSGND